MRKQSQSQKTLEMCVFALLGGVMFASKILMEALPNIHLLGMLTMTYTLVFRKKALIPIYLYVFLNGLFAGFNLWWMPYLYIWTILWGVTMLLPRNWSKKTKAIVYPLVCACHGALFGILYAPAQALMFHLTWKETIVWLVSGLTFDLLHTVGNFVAGLAILPLSELLFKLTKNKM